MIFRLNKAEWLVPDHWLVLYTGPDDFDRYIEIDDSSLIKIMKKMGITKSSPTLIKILDLREVSYWKKDITGLFIADPKVPPTGCKKGGHPNNWDFDRVQVSVCNPCDCVEKVISLYGCSSLTMEEIASDILIHELTHAEQMTRHGRSLFHNMYRGDRKAREKFEKEAQSAGNQHLNDISMHKINPLIRFR